MRKSIFALLALVISLFGTQCWAQAAACGGLEQPPCPLSITNTFSPGTTTNTYDFSATGDGTLTVHFVRVLTTFTLTVTVDHTIDGLAEGVFPPNTACVKYATNGSQCDEYDFTGNKGGPNGVPVKGTDYRGLITLTLSYFYFGPVHNPAFLHAPGDNATAVYTEDILRTYSSYPPCPDEVTCDNAPPVTKTNTPNNAAVGDPTMDGDTPGLSAVAAFDKPLEETDCFQWVSPTQNEVFTAGEEIEVEFQLFHGNTCAGAPIRDKDARLSLSRVDNRHLVLVRIGKDEGGNHFHFDNEDGVNEREVDTEGLQPGIYIITVFSDEFSPQTRTVIIQ
jgi:hypothetical protein